MGRFLSLLASMFMCVGSALLALAIATVPTSALALSSPGGGGKCPYAPFSDKCTHEYDCQLYEPTKKGEVFECVDSFDGPDTGCLNKKECANCSCQLGTVKDKSGKRVLRYECGCW